MTFQKHSHCPSLKKIDKATGPRNNWTGVRSWAQGREPRSHSIPGRRGNPFLRQAACPVPFFGPGWGSPQGFLAKSEVGPLNPTYSQRQRATGSLTWAVPRERMASSEEHRPSVPKYRCREAQRQGPPCGVLVQGWGMLLMPHVPAA